MNESAQPLRQPPVRMPKQDLGGFFAAEPPTDRSEGLAGLLAPLAPPVVDSSPPIDHVIEDGTADQRTDGADLTSAGRPSVDEATALETPTATANGVNETPDRAPSDDAPPASSGGRKKTYVYVRWPIRDRLKAFVEQSPDDLTHADVVRRDLKRTHRQLSARFQWSPDEASDNLFSQAPARRRR